jgi:chemotaxis signal transduction protein
MEACWRKIGTLGDRSCVHLAEHLLCRNCPIFLQQKDHLFSKPIGEGAELAVDTNVNSKPARKEGPTVLLFRVGSHRYGFPARHVGSVARRSIIRSLPASSHPAVVGLTQLQGDLLPVVSMHQLLGIEASERKPEDEEIARFVVLADRRGSIALMVDRVEGIVPTDQDQIRPVPANTDRRTRSLVARILTHEDEPIALVEVDLLVNQIAGAQT